MGLDHEIIRVFECWKQGRSLFKATSLRGNDCHPYAGNGPLTAMKSAVEISKWALGDRFSFFGTSLGTIAQQPSSEDNLSFIDLDAEVDVIAKPCTGIWSCSKVESPYDGKVSSLVEIQ
ncbi:hypothetical protein DdX_16670 [Ditylenchus destructor]|uniref:Uncharacterized protein n=1 Tax=Ditylenchus destructor TaxID=166010 RepID=A0AAD4MP73_9BILA|nr:hypothetical protein DdX_16670 [Ditylenchus destructor]